MGGAVLCVRPRGLAWCEEAGVHSRAVRLQMRTPLRRPCPVHGLVSLLGSII